MTRADLRWLLLPAGMLVVAALPLPYGYYTFLRLVVTASAGLSAYLLYKSDGVTLRVIGLVAMALLFNPVFVVGLTKAIWVPINLVCAMTLGYIALTGADARAGKPPRQPSA